MSANQSIEMSVVPVSVSKVFEFPVVNVKGSIIDSLEMSYLEMAQNLVKECAKMYNFDAEEASRRLNISMLSLGEKKTKARGAKKENARKKEKSSQIPLPFTGAKKNGVCLGLKRNYGLFTQCEESKVNESGFCKSCAKEHEKTGTIDDRLNSDMFNYVSKDGKKSVPYGNIMKKMNLTKEIVMAEAVKQGIEIPEGHFAEKAKKEKKEKLAKDETEKKGKGRPKKEKKVLNTENEGSDLFAELIKQANAESDDEDEELIEMEKSKKVKKQVNDDKLAKEAEKLAKEEAKKEALRLKEEAKKAKEAEKLAKEAEKLAKEEAKKELARLKEEAKKAREILQSKSPKKEKTVENAVENKDVKEVQKEENKSPAKAKMMVQEEPEEVEIKVKKFVYNGVKYLRDFNTNKIYDKESQEEIGVFNVKTEKIEFNKLAVESEESEDEYDDEE